MTWNAADATEKTISPALAFAAGATLEWKAINGAGALSPEFVMTTEIRR